MKQILKNIYISWNHLGVLFLLIITCQNLSALVAGIAEPLEISTYEDITKWCTQIEDEYFIDKYMFENGEIIHASILHSKTMKSSIDAIFKKKKINTDY